MERVNIERFEKGSAPFFVSYEDHEESELATKDIARVGTKPVIARVLDIGTFTLRSNKSTQVDGVYERKGRSIKVNTPTQIQSEEVLAEKLRFTLTKENWVEFISWEGSITTKLTLLEDLPISAGVLASEIDPDPELETSVKKDIPKDPILV